MFVARAVPIRETPEPTPEEILDEARALREEYRNDPDRRDDECSPQAFFERVVEREDVRELLGRLAR